MNKTINYETLEEFVETPREAYLVSQVTFEPSVIIEQTNNLLVLFMEKYLDCEESKEALRNDLQTRPQLVESILFTIFDRLKEVEAMLLECQEYKVKGKDDTHTSAQVLEMSA